VITQQQEAAYVLGELISGYLELDHRGRRLARVAHAGRIHDELHRHLLERAALEQVPLAAAERRTLRAPYWLIPTTPQWDGATPLVLLDIHYRPFGFNGSPVARDGMIVWLRPTCEDAYLHSLADLWSLLDTSQGSAESLSETIGVALAWLRELEPSAA
jgi:hypothetical protein